MHCIALVGVPRQGSQGCQVLVKFKSQNLNVPFSCFKLMTWIIFEHLITMDLYVSVQRLCFQPSPENNTQ